MTQTYRVNSSHGTLKCNAETGEVVEVDAFCTPEDCEDCKKNPLSDILRVDFKECFEWWANKGKPISEYCYDFDILDVGYWYKGDGGEQGYEPAVEVWREDTLRIIIKEGIR